MLWGSWLQLTPARGLKQLTEAPWVSWRVATHTRKGIETAFFVRDILPILLQLTPARGLKRLNLTKVLPLLSGCNSHPQGD